MTAGREISPKCHVLVVDDDPLTINLLDRVLSVHWHVHTAVNLEEARAVLSRESIQIIACDHVLPDGQGLDFLLELRHARPEIVRILITGHSEEDLVIQALNSGGIFRYLVKPISCLELTQTVQDAARHHEQEIHAQSMKAHYEGAQAESALRPRTLHEALDKALHWCGVVLLAALLVAVGLLVLGTIVFILLYLLKSGMGIDLVPRKHLSDFLDLFG